LQYKHFYRHSDAVTQLREIERKQRNIRVELEKIIKA